MSELKIDVNKDGLLDKVSWVWRSPDFLSNYLEPRVTVEIATGKEGKDNYVSLDKADILKFEGRELKVGELVAREKGDDIDRRIYGFSAKAKEVKDKASGKFNKCVQIYLKIEPVVDDKNHKRSQRELGVEICHPELFNDEPEEISLSGVPG